ncbi:hypothetical protein C8J57DRAFT_1358972, partial [Mycena rebaudengoi]
TTNGRGSSLPRILFIILPVAGDLRARTYHSCLKGPDIREDTDRLVNIQTVITSYTKTECSHKAIPRHIDSLTGHILRRNILSSVDMD